MAKRHPLADCDNCPLNAPGNAFVPTKFARNGEATLTVVGEAPGYQEANRGEPFVGPSGQLLDQVLMHHGYHRDEVTLTNVCLCRPKDNATPPKAAINACRQRLIHELGVSGSKSVLALGGTAAAATANDGRTITHVRIGPAKEPLASLREVGVERVVCSWHPAYCLRSADAFPALVSDVGKLKESKRSKWQPPRWKYFDDPQTALAVIKELRANFDTLVIDIEAGIEKDISFAHPNEYDLLCVGIAYESGSAIIIGTNALADQAVIDALRDLLNNVRLIEHNGKFDNAGLYPKLGPLKLWFDTMLASYVLDERPGNHGLKVRAVEDLGAPQYDLEIQKYITKKNSNYANIPRELLYKYCAYDVACTWDLHELFIERLERESAGTVWEYDWLPAKTLRDVHDFLVAASNEIMFCFASGTKVLTRDLRWQAIEELEPGMELIGVQEHDVQQMLPATVLNTERLTKVCYEVKTATGTIVCSWDHKWPVRRVRPYRSPVVWMSTKQLAESKAEWYLLQLVTPWEEDNSREAGYLAGLYDGEGCLTYANGGKNRILQFGQNPGLVLDTAINLLRDKGFNPGVYGPYEGARDKNVSVEITNKREVLRALGQLRPVRLLAKSDDVWVGRRKYDRIKIESVTRVGEREVVGVETDTKTFIAEGFVTHNCELNGITIDKEYQKQLVLIFKERITKLEDELDHIVSESMDQEVKQRAAELELDGAIGDPDMIKHINPRSPKQVKEFLEDQGVRVESTNEDTLKRVLERVAPYSAVGRFCTTLLLHRRQQKLYSTYVEGIRKRTYRRRVYTTYLLHGTTSGRLASRNPNLQNIVRDADIRRQFSVSRPDNVLIQADYKNAELRVIATLAQDEYLRNLLSNTDPNYKFFNELSDQLYGPGNWTKEEYVRTKAFVYGIGYGREPYSIGLEFGMSPKEAQKRYDDFISLIPGVVQWQNKVRQKVLAGEDLISPFGRRRRFWLITEQNKKDVLNEALSYLPQSASSDICLSAAIELRQRLRGKAFLRLLIHDAITTECHESLADEVGNLMQEVMMAKGREFTDYVPFPVDLSVGKNWGEL